MRYGVWVTNHLRTVMEERYTEDSVYTNCCTHIVICVVHREDN